MTDEEVRATIKIATLLSDTVIDSCLKQTTTKNPPSHN